MRVVAGRLGGRRLRAPVGRRTRPTPDRVREALFSILGSVEDLRVLDLYSGSGALGIEALSRGAAEVVLVERDAHAAGVIRANLASLGAEATVLRLDALAYLAGGPGDPGPGRFDLVFADPPYSDAPRLGARLSELLRHRLRPNALIATESDKRAPLELDLPLVTERTYGDTRVALHRGP